MTKEVIRVLLVEDSSIIRSMVQKMLRQSNSCIFDITECENLTSGKQLLEHGDFDIVILDLSLPESTGVETVSTVRAVDREIPIVVFTGSDDDSLAIAAMHMGADDYLVKKEVTRGSLLSRTLQYSIQQKKSQLALNRYAVEMERLAESRARQLLHQDRLATIGAMSAGIAHEVRGPLAFISDNTHALNSQWKEISVILEGLRRNDPNNADLTYYIDETPAMIADIFNGIDRVTQITTGLKNFSRHGDAELSSVSIEDCVENALTLCRNLLKYGIDVQRKFHTNGVQLQLQSQKMVQVFVNLFYNAAQAMDNSGVISISTELDTETVNVIIEDTGPGIPEETLDTIWEPFFTTKPENTGTGLGLSICKEIVAAHGGTISAANSNAGAQFHLTLPLTAPEFTPSGYPQS